MTSDPMGTEREYATYEEARVAADAELADTEARMVAHAHVLADRFTEALSDVLPPGVRFEFDDRRIDVEAVRERYFGDDDDRYRTGKTPLRDIGALLAEVERLTRQRDDAREARGAYLTQREDLREQLEASRAEARRLANERDEANRKVEALLVGDKALSSRIWLAEEVARLKAELAAERAKPPTDTDHRHGTAPNHPKETT
jgi:hypothetical protein